MRTAASSPRGEDAGAPAKEKRLSEEPANGSGSSALAGVRVVDVSRVLAGPWASQLLADLGADVVKIERPGFGDDTRGWGPPFVQSADGKEADAAYFMCANRNKRSVAIDFAKPDGRDLVLALARGADIFIENFKTGALKRYGLDHAALAAENPKLVYCSITGFGQTGPRADQPGYDYLIQAAGGLMSITGDPDGPPTKTGLPIADLFSGMYAASAVLAALRHAEATGEGQHVDVALYDCQLAMLSHQAANYLVSGQTPRRLGAAHPNIAPYQTFETADGSIVVAVGNDRQFARFCMALGAGRLAKEKKFATNAGRVKDRAELIERLAPKLRERPSAAWLATLEAADIPCGPVNDVAAAFADPQAQARDMVWEMSRPDGANASTPAFPVKLSATPARPLHAPPALGQDTDAVLAERLGLGGDELERLRAEGVIG